ncbi:LysM peptidoglycan-binding domain-containing protein [Archangium minus]|uniref:LysM peptidoglycan-binding domain-containing protein n=1 Tax=Archangium minus TaxID=83450 RepID=A0ABY9WW82_9BACT|nr:LysM peptidoglycan-binding domain-containing protein [Archangium minus]
MSPPKGHFEFTPTHEHSHTLGGGTETASPEVLGRPGELPEDLLRRWRTSFGPHEDWKHEEPDAKDDAARERAARLRAADAAASTLEGEAGNTIQRCERKPPNSALEVVLTGEEGPVAGALVELRRKGKDGILALRSNSQGRVRFEGLLDSDAHQVRVLGVGAWSLEGTRPLPEGREASAYNAVWSPPPAGTEQHEVAQGECLWTLAVRFGVDSRTLWDGNPGLHQGERSPNILAPGDIVSVPPSPKTLVDVSTGQEVRLRCEPAEARARLRFQGVDGAARSEIRFLAKVVTADGTEHVWTGKTNGDGALDEAVPADAVSLELTLATRPHPETYHFRFAHLDPLETISGVQGRLFNLGFWCGSERDEVGPLTRRALREFQKKYGLGITGEIDGPTRARLAQLYSA